MATKRQLAIQEEAKLAKARADRAAKDKKYNDSYMAFLDDKEKKEGQSFKNWERAQDRKQKKLKEEEAQTKKQNAKEALKLKLNKQQVTEGKKSRNLAKDYSKFLKSNTGELLKELGIVSKSNNFAAEAKDIQDQIANAKDDNARKELLAGQAGLNIAQEARKEALALIESGDFDADAFSQDLSTRLGQLEDLKPEFMNELVEKSKVWGEETGSTIDKMGGGEDVSRKLEMSKEAMAGINSFEDKIFRIKSTLTDPGMQKVLIKGFFIGVAMKAATALVGVIGDLWDTFREFGVSWDSLPGAAGIAKEEAKALLDTFGTLEGVSNKTLLSMKVMSYFTGAQAEDMAKIMQLQQSITGLSKEQALGQQAEWIKEIRKEGVSANKVMGDMAANADYFANYMKEGGKNIKEAATAAAKMGLSLSDTASMAESLLDWETSIGKEMEASMILGRSINLDRARELAFQGKHVEMMEEAKRQAGGEAAFLKMNVVQREALGDAIGLQGQALSKFVTQNEDAAEASGKVRWMWIAMGAAVGGIVGLMAGMIPALIGSIPFMQKFAFKQAAKGLAVGIGTGLAGAAAGGLVGYGAQGAANMVQGKERGGPVRAGNPYVVGEKRPELFIPSVSGNILPQVPHMATGTGFVQGDVSELVAEQRRANDLAQKRFDQAETHSRKFGRDMDSAFQQR